MKKHNIIPSDSPVYEELSLIADNTKVIIFSGLPGVGKSLYVQEFQNIADNKGFSFDIIQWDVARKAFETEFILERFPMGEGTVHNGLKLIAGRWLMDTLKLWLDNHMADNRLLIIEAPLVGHRFVELIQKNKDEKLEAILSSNQVKVIMPIPSKEVRKQIEKARSEQVSEDAKVWMGAKPSVMLMLWKMTCEIANEFGMDIDLSEQPPYNPGVYEFVFGEILKHRFFVPLIIDELFDVPPQDEAALHSIDSMQASEEEANRYGQLILEEYDINDIDAIVDRWYIS